MHWIALPNNASSIFAAFDDSNVGRKKSADFRSSVASDECDLANFNRRVEGAKKSEKVGGGGCRANLDADGVLDAAEVLDVRTIYLTCTITNPEEMGAGVVPRFAVVWGVSREICST